MPELLKWVLFVFLGQSYISLCSSTQHELLFSELLVIYCPRLPKSVLEVSKKMLTESSRNPMAATIEKEAGWLLLSSLLASMPKEVRDHFRYCSFLHQATFSPITHPIPYLIILHYGAKGVETYILQFNINTIWMLRCYSPCMQELEDQVFDILPLWVSLFTGNPQNETNQTGDLISRIR